MNLKKALLVLTLFLSLFSFSQYPDIPFHPNPYQPCGMTHLENDLSERKIEAKIDRNILYGIRDNILLKSSKGKKYVEDYYYVSKFTSNISKLSINTIYLMLKNLPNIYDAYKRMTDDKYDSVVIEDDFKNDIIKIINEFKTLSTDERYLRILDNLINDLNEIANKRKKDVVNFLS